MAEGLDLRIGVWFGFWRSKKDHWMRKGGSLCGKWRTFQTPGMREPEPSDYEDVPGRCRKCQQMLAKERET